MSTEQGSGIASGPGADSAQVNFGAIFRNPVLDKPWLAEEQAREHSKVLGVQLFAGTILCLDVDTLKRMIEWLKDAYDRFERARDELRTFPDEMRNEWAEIKRLGEMRKQAALADCTVIPDIPTEHQTARMNSLIQVAEQLRDDLHAWQKRLDHLRDSVEKAWKEYTTTNKEVTREWGTLVGWRGLTSVMHSWRPGPDWIWSRLGNEQVHQIESIGIRLTDLLKSEVPDFDPNHQTVTVVAPQRIETAQETFYSFFFNYKGEHKNDIQVTKIKHTDGTVSWNVAIPGTQVWNPLSSDSVMNLDGNADLVAGRESDGMRAVDAALRAAGVKPDEPVVFFGHSQGGMTAQAIAGDSTYRKKYKVVGIITDESPRSARPVPKDVTVISLEGLDDIVPKLDGITPEGSGNHIVISGHLERPDGVSAHDPHTGADLFDETRKGSPEVDAAAKEIEKYLAKPGSQVETKLYRTEMKDKSFWEGAQQFLGVKEMTDDYNAFREDVVDAVETVQGKR